MLGDEMTGYPRSNRLSKVIMETLADELERLKDPRLDLVTITGVGVGVDLNLAIVFFGAGAGDELRLHAALQGLEAASGRLRRELGKQLRIKRVPQLRFEPDPALASGEAIENALRRIGRNSARRLQGDSE